MNVFDQSNRSLFQVLDTMANMVLLIPAACSTETQALCLISLNKREQQFSQPKLKLYGLFRALYVYKFFIVGVWNLIVEVDARYIKGMLNNPDTAPSASINH